MKNYQKLIGLMMALLLMSAQDSCSTQPKAYDPTFIIIEVDSCEYIQFYTMNPSYGYVHKGNCKNHKNK